MGEGLSMHDFDDIDFFTDKTFVESPYHYFEYLHAQVLSAVKTPPRGH